MSSLVKGATVGMLTSYLAVLLLGIFTQAARSQGTLLNKQVKPTTIENCPVWNSTSNSTFQAFVQHNTEKCVYKSNHKNRFTRLYFPLLVYHTEKMPSFCFGFLSCGTLWSALLLLSSLGQWLACSPVDRTVINWILSSVFAFCGAGLTRSEQLIWSLLYWNF